MLIFEHQFLNMDFPEKSTLPEYYQGYYAYKNSDDLYESLNDQLKKWSLLASLPEDRQVFAYAAGKWTVREVIGHLIDTERIFSYRILRMARRDSTPLPGFDENAYALAAPHRNINLAELMEEWNAVRAGLLAVLKHLADDALDETGTANGITVSPRKLAFMVYAHAEHHVSVLQERYRVEL